MGSTSFFRNEWGRCSDNSAAITRFSSWPYTRLLSQPSLWLSATAGSQAWDDSSDGLILGSIWGLWHFPAFLLSGTQQSEWSLTAFFAGCLAISVIATALFNRSHSSILLPAFFHFSLMNPVFPDAQPYDTYLLIVVAALIIWRKRKDMFTKESSVTEVIPNQRQATDDG